MVNDAYYQLGDYLRRSDVKYAFVVLKNDQVIEIGSRFKRSKYLDLIGSMEQPQS
jgi:hypothetical protein